MSWLAGWPADLAPAVAFDVLLGATVIPVLALVLVHRLRPASAAARHGVWAAVFGILLLLPVGRGIVPHWEIVPPSAAVEAWVALTTPRPSVVLPAMDTPEPADRTADQAAEGGLVAVSRSSIARSAAGVAVIAWLAGTLLLVVRMGIHVARVQAMIRRSRSAEGGAVATALGALPRSRPRVVMSGETRLPFTTGLFRPTVVLPGDVGEWSAPLIRSVLLHELAHVERHDYTTHIVSRIACAMYWPNPLVWYAARRLTAERERACDDRVLLAGSSPRTYARQLVDLARRLRTAPAAALAVAGRNDLGERIQGIVEPRTDRRPLTRGRLTRVGLILGAATLPMVVIGIQRQPDVRAVLEGLADPDPTARMRAAWKAGELEAPTPVNPLIARLTDDDPAVRGAAAWGLGEIKDRRALAPLTRALRTDADRLVREAVVLALGEIEDAAAVTPLATTFRTDAALRPAVLWALGEIATPAATAALAELRYLAPDVRPWTDGDVKTRLMVGRTGFDRAARRAAMDGDRAVARLIGRLDVPEEREAALVALGRLADARATDPIAGLLAAPEPAVRANAAWALGRIGSERAVERLLPLLRDPDIEVRAMATWALDEINPTRHSRSSR